MFDAIVITFNADMHTAILIICRHATSKNYSAAISKISGTELASCNGYVYLHAQRQPQVHARTWKGFRASWQLFTSMKTGCSTVFRAKLVS